MLYQKFVPFYCRVVCNLFTQLPVDRHFSCLQVWLFVNKAIVIILCASLLVDIRLPLYWLSIWNRKSDVCSPNPSATVFQRQGSSRTTTRTADLDFSHYRGRAVVFLTEGLLHFPDDWWFCAPILSGAYLATWCSFVKCLSKLFCKLKKKSVVRPWLGSSVG